MGMAGLDPTLVIQRAKCSYLERVVSKITSSGGTVQVLGRPKDQTIGGVEMSDEIRPDCQPASELRAMARIYQGRNQSAKAEELLQMAEQMERRARKISSRRVVDMNEWRDMRDLNSGKGDQ